TGSSLSSRQTQAFIAKARYSWWVTRQHRHVFHVLTFALFAAAEAPAAPLPALPSSGASSAPAQPGASADALADRARKGIVLVERDGRALAAGVVLANDGRIVTALSALGSSELADVRYSDGHVTKSRVGHRDKAWDLALLVPLSGKWTDGLMASE